MQKTTSQLIIEFLKKRKKSWVRGGEIARDLPTIAYPQTVSRNLRHLAEDGLIYRSERIGKDCRGRNTSFVIYQYKA